MGDRVNGLARLGEEVSRSLEEVRVASGGASRVRLRIVAREAPRLRRSRVRLRRGRIAAALAIACAAMIALAIGWPRRALTFAVGGGQSGVVGSFIAAPPVEGVPLAFSDGTRIVLAPSTRARVAAIGPKGARLLVESGTLHADVVHTGDAKWAVEAGPFEVRVTGTSFDVAWDPKDEAIVVTLRDGSVVVSGCGLGAEGRRVAKGEELRASCKPAAAAAAAPAPPAETALVAATALPDAPKPVVTATASAPPSIVSAAAAAVAKTPAAPSAADLLAEADAARYAGDLDRATDILTTVRQRFAGSDAAAAAAFALGRIAFDARHDLVAAGDWFDTYLRERPSGPLAREALGRALEARHRAGDDARAELLAVRYLGSYPDGPHANLARKLAGGAR